MTIKYKGIGKAVKKYKNPSQAAEAFGVSRQLLGHWMNTGSPAPESCLHISRITGVPLHELRGDCYSQNCKP